MGLENNPDVLVHAERLLSEVQARIAGIQEQTHDEIRSVVLETVFADTNIQTNFAGAEIRYTSMCCVVAQNILKALGEDPHSINLMAIGDITLPDFVTTATGESVPIRGTIESMLTKSFGYEDELCKSNKLDFSYDLAARGYKPARKTAFESWDRYYGFSEYQVMGSVVDNSTISNGGMPDLNIMCMAFNKKAEREGLKKRYMYPDNSLGTWKSIVKSSTTDEPGKFNEIRTEQKDCLHLTAEKVHEFYAENGKDTCDDTWYITPVGNPSGTRMTPEQLTSTCEAIIQNNPKATIILDCVYLRTLEIKTAHDLVSGVLSNPAVLSRVIFLESLSKTHGLTGLRIGMFFSTNKELYELVQNVDMTVTAGHGHNLSAKMMAFTENPDENDPKFKELHRFWGRERKGLCNYLLNGQYRDLFDEDQSHLHEDQLDEPMGLYLLVKLKPGVTKMDVYKRTGCIGVPSSLKSGQYMRFSVGKITEPTYARYADGAEA